MALVSVFVVVCLGGVLFDFGYLVMTLVVLCWCYFASFRVGLVISWSVCVVGVWLCVTFVEVLWHSFICVLAVSIFDWCWVLGFGVLRLVVLAFGGVLLAGFWVCGRVVWGLVA